VPTKKPLVPGKLIFISFNNSLAAAAAATFNGHSFFSECYSFKMSTYTDGAHAKSCVIFVCFKECNWTALNSDQTYYLNMVTLLQGFEFN